MEHLNPYNEWQAIERTAWTHGWLDASSNQWLCPYYNGNLRAAWQRGHSAYFDYLLEGERD